MNKIICFTVCSVSVNVGIVNFHIFYSITNQLYSHTYMYMQDLPLSRYSLSLQNPNSHIYINVTSVIF